MKHYRNFRGSSMNLTIVIILYLCLALQHYAQDLCSCTLEKFITMLNSYNMKQMIQHNIPSHLCFTVYSIPWTQNKPLMSSKITLRHIHVLISNFLNYLYLLSLLSEPSSDSLSILILVLIELCFEKNERVETSYFEDYRMIMSHKILTLEEDWD